MPTVRESVCCCEIDQMNQKHKICNGDVVVCITDHEGFEPVDRMVLGVAREKRQDHTTELCCQ